MNTNHIIRIEPELCARGPPPVLVIRGTNGIENLAIHPQVGELGFMPLYPEKSPSHLYGVRCNAVAFVRQKAYEPARYPPHKKYLRALATQQRHTCARRGEAPHSGVVPRK